MIDALKQRRIFWLLKRYTSLTFWMRIQNVNEAFFEKVEHEVTHHPKNDSDYMLIEMYKRCLDDRIHFKKGLERLEVGDRSVFRRHEEGYLSDCGSASSYMVALANGQGYPAEWSHLEIFGFKANAAFAGSIYEPKEGASAAWYATWLLMDRNLPKFAFPDPLPPTPDPPPPNPRF